MRERTTRDSGRKKTNASDWAKQQSAGGGSKAYKLPPGVDPYKLEVGVHTVDVMPFKAGKDNKRADAGMEHFEREFEVHRLPVPGGREFHCCLRANWGKTCPVCKFSTTCSDADLVKDIRGQTRHLWLLNTQPGKVPGKKNSLKVFDSNHYAKGSGFGEMMADAINAVEKYNRFADLVGGYTLQLTVKEDTWPGGKFNKVTRIDFLKRDYDYEEDLIDSIPCLDDMIVQPDAKVLAQLVDMSGTTAEGEDDEEEPVKRKVADVGDDEEAERPKKKVAKADADDEDDPPAKTAKHKFKKGDEVTHGGEIKEVAKVNADGTLDLEDEDGDVETDVDAADVKVKGGKKAAKAESEDDDDPPPAKKPGKKKPVEEDDEDDPLEDEDDPDETDEDEDEDDSELEPDDEDEDEDDSELEPDDEDEDDPPPAKKTGKKKPVEEDDEDED